MQQIYASGVKLSAKQFNIVIAHARKMLLSLYETGNPICTHKSEGETTTIVHFQSIPKIIQKISGSVFISMRYANKPNTPNLFARAARN